MASAEQWRHIVKKPLICQAGSAAEASVNSLPIGKGQHIYHKQIINCCQADLDHQLGKGKYKIVKEGQE